MSTNKQTACYVAPFLLAVITGIIVSCLGQPYNSFVFGLHKIVAIGTIILAIIFIRRQIKQTGAAPAVKNSIIVMAISGVVLAATGALMSVGVGGNFVRIVHAFAPALSAAAIVAVYALLKKRKNAPSPSRGSAA